MTAEATYYLSFAGETGWIGGAYVRAPSGDYAAAVTTAHREGCNPGGEVQILELPLEAAEQIPDDQLGILLDREGIELGKEAGG